MTNTQKNITLMSQEMQDMLSAEPAALDFTTPVKTIGSTNAIPPKPTTQLKKMLTNMKYAVDMKENMGVNCPIMLMTSGHGTGKTFAAMMFQASRSNVLYLEVPPRYDGEQVVKSILKLLGLNPGTDWDMRTSTLIDFLRQYPHTIILDEMHEAKRGALTQIKHIADQADITFILIGAAKLKYLVEADPAIDSRVRVAIEAEPIPETEYKRLFTPDGYTSEVLAALYSVTKGVMRRTVTMQLHLDYGISRVPGMARGDLTVDHVRAAAEVVR